MTISVVESIEVLLFERPDEVPQLGLSEGKLRDIVATCRVPYKRKRNGENRESIKRAVKWLAIGGQPMRPRRIVGSMAETGAIRE